MDTVWGRGAGRGRGVGRSRFHYFSIFLGCVMVYFISVTFQGKLLSAFIGVGVLLWSNCISFFMIELMKYVIILH